MPDKFEDELTRIAEIFGNKLFDILYGIKRENHYAKKESHMKAAHESRLCEACKKGKCVLKDRED